MRTLVTVLAVVTALAVLPPAQGHLVQRMHHSDSRATLHVAAYRDYRHSIYVCVRGRGRPKREHCRSLPWLRRVLSATEPLPSVDTWISRQIAAANVLGSESGGDPWPNCPDPYDGEGSWQDTVNCENGGSWYDSPGYYRCGLQFDPAWERRFGRLCP